MEEESLKRITSLVREEGSRNARIMFTHPTALEREIREILDANGIKYTFQKPLYRFIKGYRHYVESYYIANFWLPSKKIILDVESSFRNASVRSTGVRTYDNEGITPVATVLKIKEEDLKYPAFKEELLALLK